MRLSKRLEKVASFVEEGAILADIGSDHAYLPTALVQAGKIERAVAGEVVQGPFDSAVRNVEKEGVAEQITVRLANGLAAIEKEDQIDTVTIAGMGGALIATILEEGKERLTTVKRLILQPNIHAQIIRDWAIDNDWLIYDEAILKEDEKIYEIVVLERGQKLYTASERLLGPFLQVERNAVFQEKWKKECVHWQEVLQSLEKAESTEQVEQKKQELREKLVLVKEVLA